VAILNALVSPNELDRNAEAANVVDGIFALARAVGRIAPADAPLDVQRGMSAGPTPGLYAIADALDKCAVSLGRIADALEARSD
jgi:hypothetical protein